MDPALIHGPSFYRPYIPFLLLRTASKTVARSEPIVVTPLTSVHRLTCPHPYFNANNLLMIINVRETQLKRYYFQVFTILHNIGDVSICSQRLQKDYTLYFFLI